MWDVGNARVDVMSTSWHQWLREADRPAHPKGYYNQAQIGELLQVLLDQINDLRAEVEALKPQVATYELPQGIMSVSTTGRHMITWNQLSDGHVADD